MLQTFEGPWALKGTLNTKYIPHFIDFSADGMFLRSVDKPIADASASYTLTVWDLSVSFGTTVTAVEVLRGISGWATHSCPCAWDLKGVWSGRINRQPPPPGVTPPPWEPTPIASIDSMRSLDRSNNLLVTGENDGLLTMHKLPSMVYTPTAEADTAVKLALHSGPVSCVLFIEEGTRMVTAGSLDGLIQVCNPKVPVCYTFCPLWSRLHQRGTLCNRPHAISLYLRPLQVWKVKLDEEGTDPILEPEQPGEEEDKKDEDEEEEEPAEPPMYDSADDEGMTLFDTIAHFVYWCICFLLWSSFDRLD